jgi:hypothetical protein
MKTVHLVFVLFACVATTSGAGYADKTGSGEQPDPSGGQTRPKLRPASRKGPAQSNPPKLLPKRPAHLLAPSSISPRRGSVGSSPVAKGAVRQSRIAGRSGPRLAGPAAPLRSNVRHRSPNPAVISGSTQLSTSNNGAIDGRQVHRRP